MKINQIYIFRFIAALLVVFYHFFSSYFRDTPLLYNIFSHGDEAVTFFFALSGFIMVISYNDKLHSTKEKYKYWIARLARIYPLYLFAFLLFIAYYVFIDNTFASSVIKRSVPEVLLVQSWLGKTSLNFPGWSLSAEAFFYLLFPFIFIRIKNRHPIKLLLSTAFIFVTIQVLIYMLLHKSLLAGNVQFEAAMFYSPYCHVITFFTGVSMGILYVRYYTTIINRQFLVITSSIISIVLYSYIVYLSNQNLALGILTPVYCLFILMISMPVFRIKILTNKLAIFLGDISYGVYILQYPVYLFASFYLGQHLGPHPFMTITILLLVVLSSVTYFVIEKPGSKLLKWGFSKVVAK